MSELLDVFIGESRENLESASQELLEIQSSGPASERVDKIFRDLHTIKGSSDLFDIKLNIENKNISIFSCLFLITLLYFCIK